MECAVPMCINSQRNSKRSGLTFYPFPKDPDLRKAWIKALGVKNLTAKSKSKICSEHFPEESFFETKLGRKLHSSALPVIILDPTVSAALMTCRICLGHHRNMRNIREYSQAFEQITSISASEGESRRLPQCICKECAARLTNAATFRAKALLSDGLQRDLLKPDTFIRIRDVKTINRKHFGLQTTLVQKHFDCDHFDLHIDDSYADPDNDTYLCDEYIDLQAEISNKQPENEPKDLELHTSSLDGIGEEQVNEVPETVELDDVKKTVPDINKLNQNISLYVEHNYSNAVTTKDNIIVNNNNEEVIKENIVVNNKDSDKHILSNNDGNFNDSDGDMVNKDKDVSENNNHIGNWNIEVEKCSKTITIIPLNVKDKQVTGTMKTKPALKREMSTVRRNRGHVATRPKTIKRHIREIDPEYFDFRVLSYEEQVLEIEKRQERAPYKYLPFKCAVCYTAFKREDVFKRHMLKHSDKTGLVECFICKIRKKTKAELNQHLRGRHSREYTCRKCPFVTRFKKIALTHEDFHTGRCQYKCELCDFVFERQSAYFGHRRLYHTSNIVCALCGFTFVSQAGLHSHRLRKHILEKDMELKGPYCEKCDIKFLSEEAHDVHLRCSSRHLQGEHDPIRIRNEPGPKTRPIPRRRRNRDMTGSNKKKTEKEVTEPYICEQCGKELRNYASYSLHFTHAHPSQTRGQHPLEQLTWMCDHCGKMFRTKYSLESHQWVHTGEKTFQCDYCGKKFCQRATLRGHIQARHEENSPVNKCQLCDKVFTLAYNLKKHLLTHFGEKPHGCEVCQKRFTTTNSLHSHVRHVHYKIPWPKKRQKITKDVDEE